MGESIREIHTKCNVPSRADSLIIAGDVSATNVLVGIYSVKDGEIATIFEATYKGQSLNDFNEQVIKDMLELTKLNNRNIHAAVFSPAGPIIDRKCQMTNAPFSLDSSSMGIPTALINDFKAIAYAVATLGLQGKLNHTQLHSSNSPVKAVDGGRIGIHGAGTGLGTSRLEYNNEKKLYFPLDSEGGHKFLPIDPSSETEAEIAKWLMMYTNGRKPNYEDVLSGRGIERIFDFFAYQHLMQKGAREISNFLEQKEKSEDKAEYIGKIAAYPNTHKIFSDAMDFFWKTYGRALHDLAVHENARGGIWVAGGIIRKHYGESNSQHYKNYLEKTIMEEFNSGKTHRDWVGQIPVNVILEKRVGLEGCIQVAANKEYMNKEMH